MAPEVSPGRAVRSGSGGKGEGRSTRRIERGEPVGSIECGGVLAIVRQILQRILLTWKDFF